MYGRGGVGGWSDHLWGCRGARTEGIVDDGNGDGGRLQGVSEASFQLLGRFHPLGVFPRSVSARMQVL